MTNLPSYIAVIQTGPAHNVVLDAARPWAVVLYNPETQAVVGVCSRHETYKGACVAAGKRVANAKRESRAALTPTTAAEG